MKQKFIRYCIKCAFLIVIVSTGIFSWGMERLQIAGPPGYSVSSFNAGGSIIKKGKAQTSRNGDLTEFSIPAVSQVRADNTVKKVFEAEPGKDDIKAIYYGQRLAVNSYLIDSAAMLCDLREAYVDMSQAGIDIHHQSPDLYRIRSDSAEIRQKVENQLDLKLDNSSEVPGFSQKFKAVYPKVYAAAVQKYVDKVEREIKKSMGEVGVISDPNLVSAILYFKPILNNEEKLSTVQVKHYFNHALSLYKAAKTENEKIVFAQITNKCFFDHLFTLTIQDIVLKASDFEDTNIFVHLDIFKKTNKHLVSLIECLPHDNHKKLDLRKKIVATLDEVYFQLQSDSAIYADLERIYPILFSKFDESFMSECEILRKRGEFFLLEKQGVDRPDDKIEFSIGGRKFVTFSKSKLHEMIVKESDEKRCSSYQTIKSDKALQGAIELHWMTSILGERFVRNLANQCSDGIEDPLGSLLRVIPRKKEMGSLTKPATKEELRKMQQSEDSFRSPNQKRKKGKASKRRAHPGFEIESSGELPEEDPIDPLSDAINRAPIEGTHLVSAASAGVAPEYCSAQDGWQMVASIPNPKELSGYSHRVFKWFEPEFRSTQDESSLRYHTAVPLLVDKYAITYGKTVKRPNATHSGQMDTQYRLNGQRIEPNGATSYIEINCTLDPNGICYHRDSREISNPSIELLKAAKPLEWITTEGLSMSRDDLAPVSSEYLDLRLLYGKIISQDELHVRISDPYNGGEVILFLPMRGKK